MVSLVITQSFQRGTCVGVLEGQWISPEIFLNSGTGSLASRTSIRYAEAAITQQELMTILRLLFLSMFLSVVSAAQTKTIAITIDDLPYATLNPTMTSVIQARQDIRSITQTLKAHNAPAVAFVNEQKLQVPDQVDMRIGLL